MSSKPCLRGALGALGALILAALAATAPRGASASAASGAQPPAETRAAAETKTATTVLQYHGHSCFTIITPGGARIVLDPYASGEWPGLELPYLQADYVLITHPHWDHSAWRAVHGRPKLIDVLGQTRAKDAIITGLKGRHAENGGAGIAYRNTILVIETGGLRLCHLGDNGPPTAELVSAIGGVDVLMIPIDAEKRVLTYEQAKEWIDALAPRLVIPMHYRLPGLSLEHISGIGTIDEWLSLQPSPIRLPGDRLELTPAELPPRGARHVEVFTLAGQAPPDAAAPAPGKGDATAARRRGEQAAVEGDTATALAEFTKALAIDPLDVDVMEKIGFLHLGSSRPDLALEFFQKATSSGAASPASAATAWLGAGMALDLLGRREEAKAAYRKVVGLGVNDEHQIDTALGYLESPYQND